MKTVIGLEIHVQLKTKSKMFCGCPNGLSQGAGRLSNDNNDTRQAISDTPNSRVCPVCLGMPGVLPVANRQAIEWVIKTGLALNAEIQPKSKFDRKHYFYPDLPKGYQISQYDEPFAKGGYLELNTENLGLRKIRLRRIHLEEDAGKLVHISGSHPEAVAEGSPANATYLESPAGSRGDSSPVARNDVSGDYSLVDLNRAGTPLMEIVTEPDINSPAEAKLFMQKLRTILRHLDVSDADMEKGHLRCDANISISQSVNQLSSQTEEQREGTPVEIKNMNSFRSVERALAYEEKRQQEAIKSGEAIQKETRGWSNAKQMTVPQRSKEYSHDYRYFPEPDLPPFLISQSQISNLKSQISEGIEAAAGRYQKMGIGQADINVLMTNLPKKRYFDQLAEKLENDEEKVLAAKWLVNRFYQKDFSVDAYADFIKKLAGGEIPQARAMEVIKKSSTEKKSIDQIVAELGLTKIDEGDKIDAAVSDVISENQKAVEDIKTGKEVALKFLIGQVMAKTHGQADPQMVEKILKEKLL